MYKCMVNRWFGKCNFVFVFPGWCRDLQLLTRLRYSEGDEESLNGKFFCSIQSQSTLKYSLGV